VVAEPTTGTQLLTWGEEGVPEWRRPKDVDLDPTLGSAHGGSTGGGSASPRAPSTGMARDDSDSLRGLQEMSSEIFMEEADAAAKAWIDVDAVEAVLRDDVTPHARMCHRQRAEVQSGLTGTMAVQIVIGTDGKVTAVYLDRESSTLTDEEILECIERAIRARGFPRAFGGPATLTYPFRFTGG